MKTIMNVDKLNTIDQLTDFLDGTQPIAFHISDNEAAEQLQKARRLLFNTIHEQEKIRA